MNLLASHKKSVQKISLQIKKFRKSNPTKQIRFTHGSTNSTRVQDKAGYQLINISNLNKVIKLDVANKLALVEPNVSMEQLVDACLAVGLLPKVVMEFPAITCGGGVNGAALEASSFRYGQFNDTCREYEVILGTGAVITLTKEKNADLFFGLSGSYGSLALVTLITVELIPAKPYVQVSFLPVKTTNLVAAISNKLQKNYDYLEGLIFDKKHSLLLTGEFSTKTALPISTFSKATDEWFFLFAKQQLPKTQAQRLVPIKDYLFRYDRGAFWMGEHAFKIFHFPFNKFMRWLLNPFMHTKTMYKGLHDTNIAQTLFIQDFYLPFSQTKKFLQQCFAELGIFPLWLCPIKSTKTLQKLSPHYLKEKMLIDVGIWGTLPAAKINLEKKNKKFEELVAHSGGRKMFYAESFYSEQEFWKIYDKKWYTALRKKYHAEEIFPTIWQKVTVKKSYKVSKKKILKTIFQTLFSYDISNN